jgi:dihydropteroate synthase
MSFGRVVLDWSRVYVVGVLNVTPDSFSDGGFWDDPDGAVARARDLVAAGADVVDIGGCSTRPGAEPVPESLEIDRVVPVIEALGGIEAVISVDTTSAEVARRAVAAGAEIINDISGGLFDDAMAAVVAESGAVWVAGHVRGRDITATHASESTPPTVDEVITELADRIAAVAARRVIADPGLGFGKRGRENLALIKHVDRIADALQCPVMLGPSRKRFLQDFAARSDRSPAKSSDNRHDRDDATIGAALAAAGCGAHFVRVHAVDRVRAALCAFEAVTG